MTTGFSRRRPGVAGPTVILALAVLLAACGDDEGSTGTTAGTTTASAATTTVGSTTTAGTTTTVPAGPAISQIELLSGMLQGLLTTEEVAAALGGGLSPADEGRQIVPPGVNRRTVSLCPEGQAILDMMDPAYDPQVLATFAVGADQEEASRRAWVTESLLYAEAGQNASDFATLVSAIGTCAAGPAWTTPDGDLVRIDRLDLPALGDESYGYRIILNEGTGRDPQLESHVLTVRVGPGLLEVASNMIRNAPEPVAIGDGGLRNVAEAALAKIAGGLAEAGPLTVAPTDEETLISYAGALWGLLTTEEIGGGWVDQGRMIVPPGTPGQGFAAGLLCPEGQALVEPIGAALDTLAYSSYGQQASPTVTEGLVLGHQAQLAADFAAGAAALEACFDREPWQTDEMGSIRMHALDLPALGDQSITYYLGPGTMPGADPWIEWQVVHVLVAELDPSNDLSTAITIAVTTIHDPARQPVEMLDHEEIARIAEAAVDRFEYNG